MMGTYRFFPRCGLLAVMALAWPASAHPDDLIPATEVPASRGSWPNQWLPSAKALAEIAPAGGGHSAPKSATEGHGAPTATGTSEGQKSFSGKEIGAPPPLPSVTIGGKVVETKVSALAKLHAATTPVALQNPSYKFVLDRRVALTPYAHNPQQGQEQSANVLKLNLIPKVQVVELTDLACASCLNELAKLEPVLQDFSSSIVRTHIQASQGTQQDTNLPAFYGKVAARSGTFWAYRQALLSLAGAQASGGAEATIPPDAALEALLATGLKERAVRQIMLSDARRFYRELDADQLLARHFALTNPPELLVNGIHLGGANGLPLALLRDVLTYVQNRLHAQLEEPQ
jgi:hypothetical protein